MKIRLIIFGLFCYFSPFLRAAVTSTATNAGRVTITSTVTRSGDILTITSTITGFNSSSKATYVYAGFSLFRGTGTANNLLTDSCVGNSTWVRTISAPQASGPYYIRTFVQTETNSANIIIGTWPLIDEPILLNQTVTLSPSAGSATIVTGQTFNGIASGAQAGNSYNISITSGSGGALIDASTGAYTITSDSTTGTIHYKVWISAGNGYSRSADAEADIIVNASKKVTVTIPANNSSYPIKYTLTQGGVVIGTYTQPAGHSAYILQIDVGANDGTVSMTATISGVKKDGNSIIVGNSQDEVVYVVSNSIVPDVATTVTAPVINDIKSPDDTVSTSVWTAGNQSSDPNAQIDLLTNQVFREGIDKVLSQYSTSNSTSSSDDTGLDLTSLDEATPNVTLSGVQALKSKLPESPQFSSVAQTDKVSITFPMITGLNETQDFSFTWNYSEWVSRLAWLRAFILGCMSVWFFFAINKQLRNSVAN